MNNDHLNRVAAYRLAMAVADKLLHEGVITTRDYERIDALILAKYGLFIRSIYR